MTTGRKATGARGEAIAARYLQRAGYEIVTTNWRCRRGEIDLIARDGATLVFVEVRTRRSADLGSPEESITAAKQRRLRQLAELYLLFLEDSGQPWQGPWRIDVVALQFGLHATTGLNHLINAVEGE